MKISPKQQKAILNQQTLVGSAGLNIPELPEDASDDMILSALASLNEAQTIILARRRILAAEAEELSMSKIGATFSEDRALLESSLINNILREAKEGITNHTAIADL